MTRYRGRHAEGTAFRAALMAWGTMVRCSSCGSWVPPDGIVVHWQLRHPGLGHPAIGAPEHLPEDLVDDVVEAEGPALLED